MISPEQSRAGRALLGWTQDELAVASRITKKTIADYERGARAVRDGTSLALAATLEAAGVEFIPEGEKGAGVRLRKALPRLFRRDHVPHRGWVAFAFDYRGTRHIGFVADNALACIALDNLSPEQVFDRDRNRILLHAAEKVDANEFDDQGRVMIRPGDLPVVEFGMAEAQV